MRQQGRVIGSRASGWHPRGRAAPIDAQAVEAARPKLITARQERAARDLIESISNVTRIKIIRALAETPLAAGDLARVVDRTAPATSQHIRVLRDAGVIESTRSGNVVRYRLTNSTSAQILEVIARAFDVLAR
ncbi:MAG: helix-turn-helix transcriptional regulator [Chloroflexi bacterium]|nr:MAG: helix-turn-helix transcriptional regulator [Chloroflexota bacterium]TMF56427.1 MAG: helix-turn-helix transcriptional regulator [Chloroflexota bacterium]